MKEMNKSMSDKVSLHLRLTPEIHQLISEYEKKDNCTTMNEFVERAVEFYVGYLSAEDCLRFLPPTLAAAVRGTVWTARIISAVCCSSCRWNGI